MNKETRYIPVEVSDEGEGRNIYGRAIVFDSYSKFGQYLPNQSGFYEKINRSAITQELIDNSDIVFNFNHDSNKVLARRNKGKGSLDVELREDGVYFSFEAPKTSLGNDLLEQVKRGDIFTCSFSFAVSREKGSQKWEKRDGVMYREIMKIDGLYDLSAVTYEAYSDTSINARSLEARDAAEKEIEEEEKEIEEEKQEEVKEEQEEVKEEVKEEQEEVKEEERDNTPKVEDIEKILDNQEVKEEIPAEETRNEEIDVNSEKRDINIKNKNNHNIMNKSLVKEIRNAIENNEKSFVINAETRSVTVDGYGEGASAVPGVHDQVVETEIQGILEPLYAKSVLAQLGVKFYPGLPQGDIQIPAAGKGTVGWAGEIEEASASGNTFSTIKLSPKRLTAYVDISKKLIAQDTIGVENFIRRDIVNALSDKLEATIFGYAAGTDDQPAGLFYTGILPAAASVSTYAGLCDAEAAIEDNNFYGEMKYLVNPKGKAKLRAMAKGAKSTQLVMENNNVDGTPVISTSNVKDQASTNPKAIFGDFSQIAVGSWGNIEVTVDPYTQATKGCVRLVINAFFDCKVLRKEAFSVMTLS